MNTIEKNKEPEAIDTHEVINPDDYTLEQLYLAVQLERLGSSDGRVEKELKELTDLQGVTSKLQDLIAAINAKTEKGKLKVEKGSDLEKLIIEAQKQGVAVSKTSGEFDSVERERLIDNIRMKMTDYSTKAEMQMQAVNRITNDRNQSIQFSFSGLKQLSEVKKTMARNAKI